MQQRLYYKYTYRAAVHYSRCAQSPASKWCFVQPSGFKYKKGLRSAANDVTASGIEAT